MSETEPPRNLLRYATVGLEFTFHLVYDRIAGYSNVPVNRLPISIKNR